MGGGNIWQQRLVIAVRGKRFDDLYVLLQTDSGDRIESSSLRCQVAGRCRLMSRRLRHNRLLLCHRLSAITHLIGLIDQAGRCRHDVLHVFHLFEKSQSAYLRDAVVCGARRRDRPKSKNSPAAVIANAANRSPNGADPVTGITPPLGFELTVTVNDDDA